MTHMSRNAPIPKPRQTHTLTSPPVWASAGFGSRGGPAGLLATRMATGISGTEMTVPHAGQGRLLPAAASEASTFFCTLGN